jgi:Holliday junction resolvasome RuvABC endonuclease subunit
MSLKKTEGGLDLADSSPVYLGIDQSFTGFAMCAYKDDKYYAEVYKSTNRGMPRMLDIRNFIRDWLTQVTIADVAMEGYAMGAKGMVFNLGELGGLVKMELADFGHYPLIIPPTTLKKYVTGAGTGQKNQMILHTYKKWGPTFTDDNACDAYGLARLCSGDGKLAYEKAIYQQVQSPDYREI